MTPPCHKKHTSTLIYSGKNSNEGQRSLRGKTHKSYTSKTNQIKIISKFKKKIIDIHY